MLSSRENPALPAAGGPGPEGPLSTGQTTPWGPLFGAERLSPPSGSSAPLKISFSPLRALLPRDTGSQAALCCTVREARQPPRAQTLVFLFSASCRPTWRNPAQQAQGPFICARCHSAVFKVIHAVVVMSLRSLIYGIAHRQWLIAIMRALTDFHTTCWCLLLFRLLCYASAYVWFQTNAFLRCGPWKTGMSPHLVPGLKAEPPENGECMAIPWGGSLGSSA